MIVVKRYPNRKLYDTSSKRYITLDGIAELIRDGQEVQVLDHSSGEDLTAVTLTQIIFEQEKKEGGFLPRSVLTGLIQSGGLTLGSLRRTLASPLDLFRHVDQEISRRLKSLVGKGEITQEEAAHLEDLLTASDHHPPGGAFASDVEIERFLKTQDIPTQEDLQKLNQRLEELVGKLEELQA